MSVDIANESGTEVPEDLLLDVSRFALGELEVNPGAELAITLVDIDTMAELHVKWMDLPGPTDVMSFPMDELVPGGRPDAKAAGPAMLGDIVLCPEFAATQAAEVKRSLDHELALLTIHGILHLLGFDHATPEEERAMFAIQDKVLADWFDHRRAQSRAARIAERDGKLLGKIGLQARERDSER